MNMRCSMLGCLIGIVLFPYLWAADAMQNSFQNTFHVDKTTLANQGSNPFMILKPGYKLVLADGKDTLTVTVLDQTKLVDGVETRVVEERETAKGELAEVSRNYFAIDKASGDLYYFGEDTDTYDNGKVTGHEGSWLAGINGARFGLMLPGRPRVGQRYYQELAPKLAMDRAQVVSLNETVKVLMGTFNHCLKTRESSDLERGTEDKLYAPGVGLLRDGDFKLSKIELPISATGLPDPVAQTFRKEFPQAQIEKLEVEAEHGAGVYDFEFREGTTEKETDITAEGTMLEFTIVVAAQDVPAAAMKTVRQAAAGAPLGRIEHIIISYKLKDGTPLRLAQPVTHYAVEFTQDGKTTEIVVDPNGAIVKEDD